MVAAVRYDEMSFWAGVSVGCRMKGYTAYGTMMGWDPDGDLIIRPITQGVPSIKFGSDGTFTVAAMTDTVDEDTVFPAQELPEITETIPAIIFGSDGSFAVAALNERLGEEQVIQSYSIDKDITPLEYDDTLVTITSSGEFVLKTTFEQYSEAADIDHGNLQILYVNTDQFDSIESQEVSSC